VEYALVPYSMTAYYDRDNSINDCYSFTAYAPAATCAPVHGGEQPAEGAVAGIEGHGFVMSALKMSDFRDTVILRVFNPNKTDAKMKLDLSGRFTEAYEVNLGEERQKRLVVRNGKCTVAVPAKKIVTVELVPAK